MKNEMKNRYHYVYEIIYKDSKRYIGVRSCTVRPEEDQDYQGSSKYTPDKCQVLEKNIIKIFNTREEAGEFEIYLHEQNDVANNPQFYNRARHTSTGFCTAGTSHSEETKKKIRASLSGEKNPMFGKPSPNRGKTLSEEAKKKISASLSGKPSPNRGKTLSEETKRKMSEAKSGKQPNNRDDRIHHFYNTQTQQSVFGKYSYLRQNAEKLFGFSASSVQNLKENRRNQIKNWTCVPIP